MRISRGGGEGAGAACGGGVEIGMRVADGEVLGRGRGAGYIDANGRHAREGVEELGLGERWAGRGHGGGVLREGDG